jgi:hypothetical protein
MWLELCLNLTLGLLETNKGPTTCNDTHFARMYMSALRLCRECNGRHAMILSLPECTCLPSDFVASVMGLYTLID